jgi:hypothetical protein
MRFLLVDIWADHGRRERFGDHDVFLFNPRRYLDGAAYSNYLTAERIVQLHQSGDRSMQSMLQAFRKAIHDFGAEGLAVHQNPFPPEWLVENTDGLVRVLGCFDDPQKTYVATLPVLWAFHGAYYCSPSYSESVRFSDALAMFGVMHSHWFPLSMTTPTDDLVRAVQSSWSKRAAQAVYIGKCYGEKLDKLALIDRGIGGRLRVYGQGWPLAGLGGWVAPLRGRKFFPKWVRPQSDAERLSAYLNSVIGLNMHLGDGVETGNMRMYEVPMHGAMLLSDSAGCNAHAEIFEPDIEAVFYASIEEAIDKCRYYFAHPESAIAIARRGFERARRDYHSEKVKIELFNWIVSVGACIAFKEQRPTET